jgi:hypothetical protein
MSRTRKREIFALLGACELCHLFVTTTVAPSAISQTNLSTTSSKRGCPVSVLRWNLPAECDNATLSDTAGRAEAPRGPRTGTGSLNSPSAPNDLIKDLSFSLADPNRISALLSLSSVCGAANLISHFGHFTWRRMTCWAVADMSRNRKDVDWDRFGLENRANPRSPTDGRGSVRGSDDGDWYGAYSGHRPSDELFAQEEVSFKFPYER